MIQDGPSDSGLYVVYTDPEVKIPWAKRLLLMWYDGVWSYPGSDQKFRGNVYGCLRVPAMELINTENENE